ncbi:hypothetical protein BDR06DRAFT_961171 [Suillus hirtellus]|nr:hypothetical protein BDR06DRAFT_961171 [Suillus hirtellus]
MGDEADGVMEGVSQRSFSERRMLPLPLSLEKRIGSGAWCGATGTVECYFKDEWPNPCQSLDARTIPALNLQQVDDSSKAVQPGENQERADEMNRDGGISKWKNAIRPSYRSDQDPGKLGQMDQPEYGTSCGPILMHFLSKATSESSLVIWVKTE